MKRSIRLRRMRAADRVALKKEAVKLTDVTPIVARDAETGEEEISFESFEHAVANGFNFQNLKKAIKNGTKYKGHLWSIVE